MILYDEEVKHGLSFEKADWDRNTGRFDELRILIMTCHASDGSSGNIGEIE
jgi:hypothetical protein